MKRTVQIIILFFLLIELPIALALNTNELIIRNNQFQKSLLNKFTINQALLHFSEQTETNSKNLNFALILKNQPNIVCVTRLNNREDVIDIVTAPILQQITPLNVYTLRLDVFEKYYQKAYVKPLLEIINEKTNKLKETLCNLEKENEKLKAQLSFQKNYSFLKGTTLLFAGFGLQYLWRHLNLDLNDLFK